MKLNKIINVVRLSTPDSVKKSIKNIVDQLEVNNYALTYNKEAVKLFSRFINEEKKNGQIYISTVKDAKTITNIIAIKPNLKIVRKDVFSFRLKIKK